MSSKQEEKKVGRGMFPRYAAGGRLRQHLAGLAVSAGEQAKAGFR